MVIKLYSVIWPYKKHDICHLKVTFGKTLNLKNVYRWKGDKTQELI